MTDKEIIIDGIDVSKCSSIDIDCGVVYCSEYRKNVYCESNNNCNYKQLQRKTAECEELISEKDFYLQKIETLEDKCDKLEVRLKNSENARNYAEKVCIDIELKKKIYKQALDEIEKYQKRNCETCIFNKTDKCGISCQTFVIIDIISKSRGEFIMQDRFKFRVWKKYNCPSCDGHKPEMFYDAEKTYDFLLNKIPEGCFGDILEDEKEYVVMQCTGLKDKNGKLIYEGDIVEIPSMIEENIVYKCFWSEEDAQYLFEPFIKFNENAPLRGVEEFAQTAEYIFEEEPLIIGNIYENPELLAKDGKNAK